MHRILSLVKQLFPIAWFLFVILHAKDIGQIPINPLFFGGLISGFCVTARFEFNVIDDIALLCVGLLCLFGIFTLFALGLNVFICLSIAPLVGLLLGKLHISTVDRKVADTE